MEELNEQQQQRLEKLHALQDGGLRPFGTRFPTTHTLETILQSYTDSTKEELEGTPISCTVAGRIVAMRRFGKAAFAALQEEGHRLQVYLKKDLLGDQSYELSQSFDLGDWIGVEGKLFRTKTDELTVEVHTLTFLTKGLRPLPEKWHGLTDIETRYRQRYVDLIANPSVHQVFRTRSRIINIIRSFLTEREYLEVETPMMHSIPGGATARPFVTHHNTLDVDLYLRVAPELYLKRLIVGGFRRVFEINRNFRNEGLSTRHNPEFTMVEFYWAYADYRDLLDMTETMLRTAAEEVLGSAIIAYQGASYDFGQTFTRLTLRQAILDHGDGIADSDLDSLDAARAIAERLGINIKENWGLGKVQTEIFEEVAEHKLDQPTFITEYPAEVSPLARRNDANPFVTDRFEFFVGGREIANGFSELNDAEDQAERFRAQSAEKDAGDLEAMYYDADYVRALEYGMPPTAGEGIGIDRLVMLFTDSPSIRDVLLFPAMRPEVD